MTQEDPAPLDPIVAAVAQEFGPYLSVVRRIGVLSAPAGIAVPVARLLRGRSGVSTGPKLVTLLNAVIGLAMTHYVRRSARWQRWKHRLVPRWAAVAGLAYLTLSPAAAGEWERGVILRGRSPLWAGLVSPVGVLQLGIALVGYRRYRRMKSSQEKGAADGGVVPGADGAAASCEDERQDRSATC